MVTAITCHSIGKINFPVCFYLVYGVYEPVQNIITFDVITKRLCGVRTVILVNC